MAEGRGAGHRADYYDVRDQRFLGDRTFERIRVKGEVEVPGPRVKFSELLRLTAAAFDMQERDLVRAGRQRKWVRARSMLVYLARDWGRASVKEIGQRLHRDSSIISRLYSAYAADRDRNKETLLVKQISNNAI